MKVTDTALPGVKLIEPRVFGDARGFFLESWNKRTFAANGMDMAFVQDNHSRSAKNVLRGLHYQRSRPQGKLVRVTAGEIFDVAVDIRKSSAHFGKWIGVKLTAEAFQMLWIPAGFAHGFLSLRDGTEMQYKCTDFYAPDDEGTITWNDPDIGIDWPISDNSSPLLSGKDASGMSLQRFLEHS